MGKLEYFKELEYRLRGLPERERQNIIAVYEELFQKAEANGKSEQDIVDSLGFPRVPNWDALGAPGSGPQGRAGAAGAPGASASFAPPQQPQQPLYGEPGFLAPPPPYRAPVSSGAKPWIAALALGFFNLVCILGPFLGLCGALAGLWAAAAALVLAPLIGLIGAAFPHDAAPLPLLVFGSIGAFGAGLMLVVALQFITKWFFKLTYMYIKFNWRIIKGA
jgi:uncharacterized membrane protein